MQVNVCPATLAPGFSAYSPRALKIIFDGKHVSHDLSMPSPGNKDRKADINSNVGRISLSGVQTKMAMLIDTTDESLRYALNDERSTYIAKPIPLGYHLYQRESVPANEHLTMQLAAQVYGILTARCAMAFFSDDKPVYLVKRFDIDKGDKRAQEDFAALMGYTRHHGGSEYKYINGSYEECGEIIRQYVKPWRVDVKRLFELVLFNFLTLNDDAHLKNFSLLKVGDEYRLSPAYDLVNTSLHIIQPRIFALDRGLFREGMTMSDVKSIGREDFHELGRRFGLPDKVIGKVLDTMAKKHQLVEELIGNSFLEPSLKKDYQISMDYRRKMLSF